MNFEFNVLKEFDSQAGLQPPDELNFADLLINNAVDASFCVEIKGEFIYVNHATCLMTKYSREELLTMKLQEIEIDLSVEEVWLERCQKLKQGKPFSIKSCYHTKQGIAVPVFVTLNYVQYQDREFICCFAKQQSNKVVNINDKSNSISRTSSDNKLSIEYKKKEAELENSLSILRSTLESSVNGIMAVNFEGDILYCNQKFIDMWGIPASLILHKKCPRCKSFFEVQVKDPHSFLRIVWEISGQSDFESYDIIELNDGRTFAHYSEPRWVDNKIIGRVWSIWDITESRRTEEALRQNEVRFRSLAETTEASIFLIQGRKLCYINPAAERITGYTKEELLSNFDLRRLIKNRKLRYINSENQLARSEYREIQILTKYGVEIWLGCNIKIIDGGVDFIGQTVELITAIDITDYKRAESELLQALEQAKQLSELRAHFVSMVCHQFRTPLNIVSFSNSLLKKNVNRWSPEKKLPLIERVQTAVQQISQLLDEILLLGKAEAASLKSEAKPLELNNFCEDLIAKIQLNHMQSVIEFNNEESDFIFRIDKTLLELIMTNLLDNAIKYSRENSAVNFCLSKQSNTAVFKIQDTGIGIPEADQERLFQPFYRGSNVDSLPGTGLGLSIVKTLIDLHGGEIYVESEVNVGTTFTVILPSIQ